METTPVQEAKPVAGRTGENDRRIPNFERHANTPLVEVLLKLARVFSNVDFLIGKGEFSCYDKEVLKRIEDIERLNPDTKNICSFWPIT